MPRPGLVIGLGGTGQWVLTWLKRDLLLSNNGKMPETVRLLEIDTQTRLEAGATRIVNGREEKLAEVGGVSLDKSEFVYVGGNSLPIAEAIRSSEKEYRQIRQWYHYDKWLTTQAPANFILDDGAGRLRQFGRMAVFKDILGGAAGSQIWRALRTALNTVRNSTNEQRRLEIILVGSFAGGTGSGLFIDVALIARFLAQKFNIHHVLRGFFALPSVFTNSPDTEMKARSLAAWRELNRFMVVDTDFSMPAIEYIENDPEFRIHPEKRIFDACYLVDGVRKNQPIADDAKFGVFPMITEAVSAILDEQAGTAYTQWIFTNLAPVYAKRPDLPMYSAIGAYTVQIPAHFKQEVASHQFAQKMLFNVLSPQHNADKDGRLIVSGAERHLALAAPDKNQEHRGYRGRNACQSLLRSPSSFAGKEIKPTLFHARIPHLVEQAVDEGKRPQVIERLARGGANDGWVAIFPDLGSDPQFEIISRNVKELTNYDLRKAYARREGEKEEDARARFKTIDTDIRTRFGGAASSASGDAADTFHGQFGDALKACERSQLSVFRQAVRARLNDLLNGRGEDALIARSGKLGYAWDFFDGLVAELDAFLTLMDQVKRRREDLKPELKLAGMSKQAQSYLNQTAGKKFLWFFEHPAVKGAEAGYLEAAQRLMELRREDLLHQYVVETARTMKELSIQTRDALQRWIWHLATGDAASGLPGLWEDVRGGLKSIRDAHSYDTRVAKVQRVVADEVADADEAALREALKHWEWVVEFDAEEIRPLIKVQILPYETSGGQIRQMEDPALQALDAARLEVSRKNQNALFSLAGKQFTGLAEGARVANVIKETLGSAPKAFAETVANVSAEPLFAGAPSAQCPKKSNLIRVMTSPNDPYYYGEKGLEGELRDMNQLTREKPDDTYSIQVVGSENPYKLTLVRTDDLYPYDHFQAWKDCLEAYAKHMNDEGNPLDPVLMQNFAAESRSVEYERRLTRRGEEYEPLHPRVVTLLENPVALRQFIYLYKLGNIREVDGSEDENNPGVYRWQLDWERNAGPQTIWLTRGWNYDLDKAARPDKPDIFNALHGYIVRKTTYQPRRNDAVETVFAQKVINMEMEAIGRSAEISTWQEEIAGDEGTLVARLFQIAKDPDTHEVVRKDYHDLAKVIQLMLEDRLEELGPDNKSGSKDVRNKPQVKGFARPEPQPKARPAAKKTGDKTGAKPAAKPTSKAPVKPAAKTITKKSSTGS